jgi:hypothetical protein
MVDSFSPAQFFLALVTEARGFHLPQFPAVALAACVRAELLGGMFRVDQVGAPHPLTLTPVALFHRFLSR